MKWNGRIATVLILLIFNLSVASQDQLNDGNYGIIPKPLKLQKHHKWMYISQGIDIQNRSGDWNTNRLNTYFTQNKLKVGNFFAKKIILNQSETYEQEEYALTISLDTIALHFSTQTGLNHGISSLLQLLLLNNDEGSYIYKLPLGKIEDSPSFKHRGFLLDCSRHFFEKETILKYIDLLTLYKMNVLHWHLTEDQGWRIAIDKYPKLESIASKRTELDGSEYGGIYSKADIREVVAYASKNGIEVIPEIEMPGHSQAAIAAYPHLSCIGKQVAVANDWGVFKEIYCAGNDSVFTFLEDVLTEVVDLFPSKYLHIGGDEAPKSRWEACSKCQNRIEEEGLKDEHELQAYFIKRIQTFLNSKGKEIIGWDEILEGGLTEGAIVQSWRGVEGGIAAAKQGNKVIMSPTSHAYLDYDLKAINLEKIYSFNPIPTDLSSDFHANIIGGECNMWTEHVPDEKTLDYKVFPRILGMAEALWSSGEKDFQEFRDRVQVHYAILSEYNVNYGSESEPFYYEIFTRRDSMFIAINSLDKNINILYQEKVGYRFNTTKEYKGPIYLEKDLDLGVQAYKNGKAYGSVEYIQTKIHKGLHSAVTYQDQYSPYYTAGGDTGLVDGKIGTLDFKDGSWQGFYGTDAEITLTFDSVIEIKGVELNFYQYINSWIFLPEGVKIYYSKNGKRWKLYEKDTNTFKDKNKTRGKSILGIQYTNEKKTNAKYLRVSIKNIKKVPDWHEAAGSDAWIFMDEIIVR